MKSMAVVVFAVLPVLASAQGQPKVYFDPQDSFSSYFSSALEKKNVPVTVTTDPAQADYTVKFQTKDSNGSLVRGIVSAVNGDYNSGAFNEVGMTVIDVKSKDVTFSYTCRKYDKYTGADSQRASSVAECLAKHWKNKLK